MVSMPSSLSLAGVVLAGGRSKRLGVDKATLDLDGRSLVTRTLDAISGFADPVVLADGGRGLTDASVPDGPGAGPAAGILGGASTLPDRSLLVLACDLPLVATPLLRALVGAHESLPPTVDLVVPRWKGRLEPLCAIYRPGALVRLAALVATGVLAPHRLADEPGIGTHYLEGAELERLGEPEEMFANVNRERDLERVLRLLDRD